MKLENSTVLTFTHDATDRLTGGDFGLLSGDTDRTQFDDVYLTAK